MKILLVRHGESTGNRDHIWAGVTDNELTNHGFQQATRLSTYLQAQYLSSHSDTPVVHVVYCSDLIRAKRTASLIASAFGKEPIVSPLLREQDLGWREGKSFKDGDRTAANNQSALIADPGESKDDMDKRASDFIQKFLKCHLKTHTKRPSLPDPSTSGTNPESVITVVSHGLFLLRLYYQLTNYLSINLAPSPSWSNTGCTTIRIADAVATVTDVNSVEHLQGLKRTRGGVGSSQYDTKQKKVSDFFQTKRRRPLDARQKFGVAVWSDQDRSRIPLQPQVAAVEHATEEDDLEAQIKAIDAACGA
ncbi:Putative uncharacterized protein [Taphrina deformans PYCC 5710]|uniref:Phosphoglycerate mutase family protein n=1 Tax=Taphrina deformans (strain PYCC 5710 / ATCC 11124 / CBS 356.35 / IMI 108563 / JCM 9778 / NBRC 8474) TaxID=1097556 RepID=R4X7U8_TAPDE|nr:Putative uncharacterized protein [Taphrina deformans PYCC 5710]|eukprot:CCG81526.1 Putative uncharacterized protein [Taphrina deformans PYCC 5710]